MQLDERLGPEVMVGLAFACAVGGACWVSYRVCDACIKRGGIIKRLLCILVSLILAGFSIGLGYFFAYIGWIEQEGAEFYQVTYPIAGWFGMVVGGLNSIFLVIRALRWSREDVELEELEEKLEKEAKKRANRQE